MMGESELWVRFMCKYELWMKLNYEGLILLFFLLDKVVNLLGGGSIINGIRDMEKVMSATHV